MAKQAWIKIAGTWRKVKNVWIKVDGIWKQKVIPKGRIDGVWKEFIQYYLSKYTVAWENTSLGIGESPGKTGVCDLGVLSDGSTMHYFVSSDEYYGKVTIRNPDGTYQWSIYTYDYAGTGNVMNSGPLFAGRTTSEGDVSFATGVWVIKKYKRNADKSWSIIFTLSYSESESCLIVDTDSVAYLGHRSARIRRIQSDSAWRASTLEENAPYGSDVKNLAIGGNYLYAAYRSKIAKVSKDSAFSTVWQVDCGVTIDTLTVAKNGNLIITSDTTAYEVSKDDGSILNTYTIPFKQNKLISDQIEDTFYGGSNGTLRKYDNGLGVIWSKTNSGNINDLKQVGADVFYTNKSGYTVKLTQS
ncbi:hypothetical protein M4D57_18585 [Brevibacillus borstelensis]|uniref:hypothetical protein n=1 Tax=Brevibacillus borstelensis TaxID=45462 RepID=UPI00203EABDB|nr:hypothetical protein [Brevibacillus borstelensis]MCM3560576.1 hypothetical protein [Brevibacillus borstelensis]